MTCTMYMMTYLFPNLELALDAEPFFGSSVVMLIPVCHESLRDNTNVFLF